MKKHLSLITVITISLLGFNGISQTQVKRSAPLKAIKKKSSSLVGQHSSALSRSGDITETNFTYSELTRDPATYSCETASLDIQTFDLAPTSPGEYELAIPNGEDTLYVSSVFDIFYEFTGNNDFRSTSLSGLETNLFDFREEILYRPEVNSGSLFIGVGTGYFNITTKDFYNIKLDSVFNTDGENHLAITITSDYPLVNPCSYSTPVSFVETEISENISRSSENIDTTVKIFSVYDGSPVEGLQSREVTIIDESGNELFFEQTFFENFGNELEETDRLLDSSFYNTEGQIIRKTEYAWDYDIEEFYISKETRYSWEGLNLSQRTVHQLIDPAEDLEEINNISLLYSENEILGIDVYRDTIKYIGEIPGVVDIFTKATNTESFLKIGEVTLEDDYFHQEDLDPFAFGIEASSITGFGFESTLTQSTTNIINNTPLLLMNTTQEDTEGIFEFENRTISYDPFNETNFLFSGVTFSFTENTESVFEATSSFYNPYTNTDESTDKIRIEINSVTSIIENKKGKEFNIFPTAGKGLFSTESILESVSIKNINGIELNKFEVIEQQLDLTHLSQGVYFVQYEQNEQVHVERIIIN